MPVTRTLRHAALTCLLLLLCGCNSAPLLDRPRLTPDVRLLDETFPSPTLGHPMRLRLVLSQHPTPNQPLDVLYLLHGAGANLHDWTTNSDIAALAEHNVLLVFPDAPNAFYIDEAANHLPFESYFLHDLLPEVHRLVPNAATGRNHTAIAGISRGGYGAVVLGLHHPELFSFVGSLSGALDLPERPLRPQSPLQFFALRHAFGPADDPTRRYSDPFRLLPASPAPQTPFLFVGCGESDSLLATNKAFANLLTTHAVPHDFQTVPGAHNWTAWNEQIPLLEASLLAHLNSRQTP